MAIFGLVGKSGFGREVMPLVKQFYNRDANATVEPVYVDASVGSGEVGGDKLLSECHFLGLGEQEKYFNVAIADHTARMAVAERFIKSGCMPQSIVSGNSMIFERVEIDVGAIICSFSHITSDVRIGKFFHLNIYSYVAHDSVIGDYVTFAPQVCCNGNVHIDDYAYIGTGAILKQGNPGKPLKIGKGAVVGMGAVVTKDVAPFEVVVGNPARSLRRDRS